MTRSNVRGLVAATAVALVLAGCSGGGSESEPEETPAPVRTMTEDELVAVLPTLEDVDEGSEIDRTCPSDGESNCVAPTLDGEEGLAARRSFTLAPRAKPEDIERMANGAGLPELLSANVEQWSDPRTAEARLEFFRENDGELVGDFDEPIEETGETFTPGRAGTGAVEEIEIDGHRGRVLDYEATFTFLGAEPEERLEVQVAVVVDQLVVHVVVGTSALGWERAELRTFAVDMVEDMIERLPTAEE